MVLALAWAVYLIPKALKHHDEIARTRSIDRFSTAMRVLARREPVNRRDTRLVVTPARPSGTPRVLVPSLAASAVAAVVASSDASAPVRRPGAGRAAARAAARRRLHTLIFLVSATMVTTGVAGFGYLPWWSVAAPLGMTFFFLYLCRRQVRFEEAASWAPEVETSEQPVVDEGALAPRRAIRIDAPYGTPNAAREVEEISPEEDTVALDAAELVDAVSVLTSDGGSLWDPLPVTLPTYVSKPRAARTVRTIDLGEPGTWTSGHTQADSKLVEEASTAAEEEGSFASGDQRAVGS